MMINMSADGIKVLKKTNLIANEKVAFDHTVDRNIFEMTAEFHIIVEQIS